MEKIVIWHNSLCLKSNSAKSFLEDNKIDFKERNYLENSLSKDELKELLKKLNLCAKELIRDSEKLYIDLNIQNITNEDELLELMAKNPILIQRPILVGTTKAFIARPPKRLEDIINEF